MFNGLFIALLFKFCAARIIVNLSEVSLPPSLLSSALPSDCNNFFTMSFWRHMRLIFNLNLPEAHIRAIISEHCGPFTLSIHFSQPRCIYLLQRKDSKLYE
ncbi:hypothetical protein ADN00_17815 [Ornatilinea apprima]|uniref:Uncharacterized protein n=1 Tax=Ornatilinea apprima TaxID=1134406 RepID=A0A0P6WX98_9CHLR|nr:hypothetical protein ADN00_17815 [Ornatilinea apprima]